MKKTAEIIKNKIDLKQRSIERSRRAIEKIEQSIWGYMEQTKKLGSPITSGNLRAYANQLEQEEGVLRCYIAECRELEDLLDDVEDDAE